MKTHQILVVVLVFANVVLSVVNWNIPALCGWTLALVDTIILFERDVG